MNKEEIYDNQYHHSPQAEREKALKAMEEYAKQSVINFLKWRDSKPGNPQDGSVWWWGVSEEQQYEMFIKLKNVIGEDNICPTTNEPCDDECCPPGSICNLTGDGIFPDDTHPNLKP